MAVKLSSTKNAASNGIKLLVHGLAGSGKTKLCATTDAPTIIISAEAGLLSLREHDIPVLEVATLADVHEAYAYVLAHPEYEWVGLDSISEIAEVVLNNEKKATLDPRKAYGALAEKMTDLVRAFRDLPGRNVYMSCKQERIKDEHTGIVLYAPSMPGNTLRQGISYFFDEVLALRVEADQDGKPYRCLQTVRDLQYEAKDRSGALDAYEPPNLAAIAAKIRSAVHQPAADAA